MLHDFLVATGQVFEDHLPHRLDDLAAPGRQLAQVTVHCLRAAGDHVPLRAVADGEAAPDAANYVSPSVFKSRRCS